MIGQSFDLIWENISWNIIKVMGPQSPDIDSGYFNGPESSSELTSETELFSGKEDNKVLLQLVI